jgi:formylglycine-generating enzyme
LGKRIAYVELKKEMVNKMKNWKKRIGTALAVGMAGMVFAQGSLTPLGAPAPTMKSLNEIYSAVTNQLEIAQQTGIPIDALPFTITEPGSYYVVSNLTMTATSVSGISVNADDVTIDLCGHALTGPNAASKGGIVQGGGKKRLIVRNGMVNNWKGGSFAINAPNGRVEHVVATGNIRGVNAGQIIDCEAGSNEEAGFYIISGGIIRGCRAYQNGWQGIYANMGSTIENCTTSSNGKEGIQAEFGSIIHNCTVIFNTLAGITTTHGSQIRNSVITWNQGDGIKVTSGCQVESCTISGNGKTIDGAGIRVDGSGNRLKNNVLDNNKWGIQVMETGARNTIEANNITNGEKGLYILGSSNVVSANTVLGNTENYNVAAGNQGMMLDHLDVAVAGVSNTVGQLQQQVAQLEQRLLQQSAPEGMVLIPGGTNSGTDPDFGAYSLTVDPFYMDRTPVTKEQWDEVYTWAVARGYTFDRAGSGKGVGHPVQTINWYDAVKWCNARSQKEGRLPVYSVSGSAPQSVYRTGRPAEGTDVVQNSSANGYRLPTVVEWEYAARGGLVGKRFPWGDTINHDHANYMANGNAYTYETSPYLQPLHHLTYATGSEPYTSPVGSFAPNGYGLYDMAGNVSSWCWDQSGSSRNLRGGSWDDGANMLRCGYENEWTPSTVRDQFGFRSVCR